MPPHCFLGGHCFLGLWGASAGWLRQPPVRAVADLQSAAEPSHPHLRRFLMVGLVLLAVQVAGLLVVVLYC